MLVKGSVTSSKSIIPFKFTSLNTVTLKLNIEALQSLQLDAISPSSQRLLLLQGTVQSRHKESSKTSQVPSTKQTEVEQSSAQMRIFSVNSHTPSPQFSTKQSSGQLASDSLPFSHFPFPHSLVEQSEAQIN